MEWVEGQLDDDIALVLMEYAGTAPMTPAPPCRAGKSAPRTSRQTRFAPGDP